MNKSKMFTLVISVMMLAIISIIPAVAQDGDFTILHFMGDCSEGFADATSLEGASTECELTQAKVAVFENETGIAVEQILTDWPGTQQLNTLLAASDAPDVSLLHGTRIPNYASRGLLTPLDDILAEAGIDASDFTETALDYVTYEGQIFGLPMDVHGHIWLLNVDVWEEAGLVDDEGNPMVPANEEEFFAAAEQMLETTGKPLVTLQTDGHNGTVWPFTSFIYQQGGTIADEEGNPTIVTPEAIKSLEFLAGLFEAGYAPELVDYTVAQETVLGGDAGGFLTGTWAIGTFEEQLNDPESSLENYLAVPFPHVFGSGVWSNSHTWVLPTGADTESAAQWLKLVYDNNNVWPISGQTSVRQSVLDSDGYLDLPGKASSIGFSADATAYPRVQWLTAYDETLNEEIQAVFLGEKDVETALQDAQARLEDFIAFSEF